MRFRAGELAFTASVTEAHDEPSAQSGAMLKWLTIQFRAQSDEMHEQALSAVNEHARGGLFDESDLEWRVVDSSVQFVGNPPWGVNHHTWIVQQVERLACTLLRLGTLELEPYDYREELTDGVLRLAARCAASESVVESVGMLALSLDPIEATRVGISDQPRPMRLRDYVWGNGAHGLGVVVLLEEVGEPQVRLGGSSASSLAEDLAALLEVDREALRTRRHAARQVRDLDAWDL